MNVLGTATYGLSANPPSTMAHRERAVQIGRPRVSTSAVASPFAARRRVRDPAFGVDPSFAAGPADCRFAGEGRARGAERERERERGGERERVPEPPHPPRVGVAAHAVQPDMYARSAVLAPRSVRGTLAR